MGWRDKSMFSATGTKWARAEVGWGEAGWRPTAASAPTKLKVAIAIATAGRRDVLTDTVLFMANQRRPPDEFLICPARPEDADVETLRACHPQITIVSAPTGLCHQRNAIMAASEADIVVFFDDDFLPAPDFLDEVDRLFGANPDVVMATGNVLADGAQGPGMGMAEGLKAVEGIGPNTAPDILHPVFNAYGCNMIVRLAPVRKQELRFDENLPFYAWLEDVDFSRQIAHYGRVVKSMRLRGVHMGTKKAGRSPGHRLGYSQIANRVYIMKKGNLPLKGVLEGSAANVLSNLLRSAFPEPWADRRGRLGGNLHAIWDMIRGKLSPGNILKM
jgi:GT2 family glycosyltransferase